MGTYDTTFGDLLDIRKRDISAHFPYLEWGKEVDVYIEEKRMPFE